MGKLVLTTSRYIYDKSKIDIGNNQSYLLFKLDVNKNKHFSYVQQYNLQHSNPEKVKGLYSHYLSKQIS